MKAGWYGRYRKLRNRVTAWFFNTRYGRELLINTIGPRVLTMTVNCGDHVMTFSPNDYIGQKVFRKGHFERDHVDRLLNILKEKHLLADGSALLELGGNIGTQTIYFALSGAFSRIISVEPDPRSFELLQWNVAQNKLQEKISLVNCAAGEIDSEIDFFQHPKNHGKSSAIRQNGSDCKITVPVKPVDRILQETNVASNAIGLVWMDIEGYEPVACRSMEALMAHKVPLYMEFSPTFYGPEQSAAFVRYLAEFYEDCLIFREDNVVAAKVASIPTNEIQFDILLYDAAI